MTQPDPCGASCEPAEDATAEARLPAVISSPRMLHVEQEIWSLSVACWAAAAAFLIVRRLTGGVPW